MRDIHCPKDIGFENIFEGKDCEAEQFYNNCFHCWSSAIAKRCQQERQRGAETNDDIRESYKKLVHKYGKDIVDNTISKMISERNQQKKRRLKGDKYEKEVYLNR